MDFSASIVAVLIALFAATAAGANFTVATNATGTLPASAGSDSSQYTCYLCHKRNSLMIRRCPIATDDCHVACLSLPTPSSPPAPPRDDNDDDCYVMKLYPDGSWVVVDVVSRRVLPRVRLRRRHHACRASVPHATKLVVVLLAIAMASATAKGGNMDLLVANATVTPGGDDTEMYICYLCAGREPMLMKYCPIYWDDCHLECYPPAAAARHRRRSRSVSECYVMKLYWNGSYAVVGRVDCSGIARCLLSCGGGDLAHRKALGAAAAMTTIHGVPPPPPPRVADTQAQRCGTQVTGLNAPTTFPGGVRRRR
ncbi:hypothetical protein PR202_ga26465 [Eleusine coracana subsp. coracana]|uniref:Uncharacterized protein n=1 Tax=Eleusine coracana subsp. coracana TaxID=191504 RepID=A0AAV5DE58_ELECO|nr:hypothetical protein PR202_ga26465 [Eleusine coracana subsp. coracana]